MKSPIGNAVVRNQYSLVLPIATGFGMAEGLKIDGMVGYQLLARFLTTIDYANSTLTLTTPSAAPASAPNRGRHSVLYRRAGSPPISIAVDGVTTSAEVDTEAVPASISRCTVPRGTPGARRAGKDAPAVIGFGVGGPALRPASGASPRFKSGHISIPNGIASFAPPERAARSPTPSIRQTSGAPSYAASTSSSITGISSSCLPRMPLLTSRSHTIVPDSSSSTANGAYTVISPSWRTPAAAAGIARGDVILTVNGSSASNESRSRRYARCSQDPRGASSTCACARRRLRPRCNVDAGRLRLVGLMKAARPVIALPTMNVCISVVPS